MCCVRWSNEAATVHADITADHRDVPANPLFFEWPAAKPRTATDLLVLLTTWLPQSGRLLYFVLVHYMVAAIWTTTLF